MTKQFTLGVITGITMMVVVFMIVAAIKGQPPQKTVASEIKANAHRIVQYNDGTLKIQYYWPYPDWKDMCGKYKTYEDAKSTMDYIDHDWSRPVIVKVFPK